MSVSNIINQDGFIDDRYNNPNLNVKLINIQNNQKVTKGSIDASPNGLIISGDTISIQNDLFVQNKISSEYFETSNFKMNTGLSLAGFITFVNGTATITCPDINSNDIIILSKNINKVGSTMVYYSVNITDGVSFNVQSQKLDGSGILNTDTSEISYCVIKI